MPGYALLSALLCQGVGCQHFSARHSMVTPEPIARPTTQVEPASPSATGPPREMAPLHATPLVSRSASDPLEPTGHAPGEIVSTRDTTPALDTRITLAGSAADPSSTAPIDRPIVLPDPVEKKGASDEQAATPEPAETPARRATPGGQESIDRTGQHSDDGGPAVRSIAAEPSPTALTGNSGDDWNEMLGRLRALARQRAGENNEAAEAWAIRSRVLDWLAGANDQPVAENDRLWNSVLAALSAATSQETAEAPQLGFHLRRAASNLESFAPLQITTLTLCRAVLGFGHYEPLRDSSVRAGQSLLVYCEIEGLKYEEGSSGYTSRLSSELELVREGSTKPIWSRSLGNAEDLCRRQRRDFYVNYRFTLPGESTLPPGPYTLRLTQTDQVSGHKVSATVDLSIVP
ncbi:MAG: hypothetical protein NVSMB9_32600 [Isosphaeraceae bacterium]